MIPQDSPAEAAIRAEVQCEVERLVHSYLMNGYRVVRTETITYKNWTYLFVVVEDEDHKVFLSDLPFTEWDR